LDSEKYEVKQWDLEAARPLEDLITRVNRIRHAEPALQASLGLSFPPVDNDQLIAYRKSGPHGEALILTVVNLHPQFTQSGWIHLPLADFQIEPGETYQVHDLLNDARYEWRGDRNYIELNPEKTPAHIFRLRRRVRAEAGGDQYL
jgi:starch synthase (maltosyl-transferring)